MAALALAVPPDQRTVVVRDDPQRCIMAPVGEPQRTVTLAIEDPQPAAAWRSSHPDAHASPDVGPDVYAVAVHGAQAVVALLPQLTLTLTGAANLDHAKSAIRQMLGA